MINLSLNLTGDPFIDLGGLVVHTLKEHFPEKTDLELIQFVTDIYINNWKKNLYSIFHTNSKILNPSTKGKHRENTITYYDCIIQNKKIDHSLENSYCKTCGKKELLYLNSREFFPNSGSGAFVNFHHAHETGIFLCKECTLKLFFIPFGVIAVGGKNGFLHSQSESVKEFWKQRVIIENLNKIFRNSSESILHTDYSNPENALFHFAGEIIRDIKDEAFSEYLQLINFTNFGTTPDCIIYILPNPVFNFLNKVLNHYGKYWYRFVNRYYRIKGAEWDFGNEQWIKRRKKEVQSLSQNDYLNNPNSLYKRLLNNRSILRLLLNTYKDHFKYQLDRFPIEITLYYITEVLNMTKEQVAIIARITDVIFELARKDNNYKKYLFLLESSGRAYQLRSALLKIIKTNFYEGAKEPLIRMKDYVEYLFPDGQNWGEVRDLLLIHLYEKLHDEGINREEIPETDIQEAKESEPINTI
ncbi:MAG: type I-B CRISPR-associated protein Cas8b1/Cst1 [bacterium]